MSSLDRLLAILSTNSDKELVARLLSHYTDLKAALFTGNWGTCLLAAGKLAEEVVRLLHLRATGELLERVEVSRYVKQRLADHTAENAFLLQHACLLYQHRSKRGGAHTSFDPQEMDAHLAGALASWILAELVRTVGSLSPSEAYEAVRAVTIRGYPLVEEVAGDRIVLESRLSLREKICLLLYHDYPHGLEQSELLRDTRAKSATFRKTLSLMERRSEIHRKDRKVYLTSQGRALAEGIIKKALSNKS